MLLVFCLIYTFYYSFFYLAVNLIGLLLEIGCSTL